MVKKLFNMKTTKINEEIINIRQTTRYEFELEREDGETMQIFLEHWIIDGEYSETDGGDDWFDENMNTLDWDKVQEWVGENEDIDDIQGELISLTYGK